MLLEKIPPKIKNILQIINAAGFQAYIVGGAVRDLLSGRSPQDYDITTDARPEQTAVIARQAGWQVIDRLGQNFGVVALVSDGEMIEVATFRGERYGTDAHRPESIWFTKNIEADLSRRDFTINAMAVDIAGQVIDPFGGQKDIAGKIIRTVGLADQRFQEDALRMFRACRFAAQLGYDIHQTIYAAIPGCLPRAAGLSLERVQGEMEKILLAACPHLGLDAVVRTGLAGASCRLRIGGVDSQVAILPELGHLVGLPQNPAYHSFDVWNHTLAAVRNVPADLILRWAALLHDVGKGLPEVRGYDAGGQPTDHQHDHAGAKIASRAMARLRINPKLAHRVVWLVARHMRYNFLRETGERTVQCWLREEARSGIFRSAADMAAAFHQLNVLCQADIRATGIPESRISPKTAAYGEKLYYMAKSMPTHTSDLDCHVAELAAIVKDGTQLGRLLKSILQRVQDGNLANEAGAITAAAQKWVKRHAGEE